MRFDYVVLADGSILKLDCVEDYQRAYEINRDELGNDVGHPSDDD